MAIVTKEATFENPPFKIFPGKSPTDNLIQRGYMRLLSENLMIGDADFKTAEELRGTVRAALEHESLGTKLNFQFNPNLLTRSVTARTDTQLWINQSPSQLLQPGIGDMNFQWSMLFNREAEVTANELSTSRRTASGMEVNRPTLDQYMGMGDVRPTSPGGRRGISGWESVFHGGTEEAAKVLGVLADISILDRITGQSITRESYEYAKRRFETLKAQGLAYDVGEGVGSQAAASEAMSLEDAAEEAFGEGKGVENLLDANVYNSAFLVPNPVRVVFSEHFMVDGYVNQVTVTFQKFSPEMVPTVATVDISMHAIYQGFTRQRTAFTTFIKLQHELDKDDEFSDGDKEPYAGEDAYVNNLVDQGGAGFQATPLFTGFDHSADHGDSNSAGLDVDSFNMIGNTPGEETALKRQEIEMDKGISFSPFCYLFDTGLGVVISEQISRVDHSTGTSALELQGETTTASQWVPDNIDAKVWTGLQIRARLKTTDGSNSDAQAAMDVLLKGPTGMSGWGEDGEVFFTDWSEGMRSDLLAIGYDNMAKTELAKSKIRERFGDPVDESGQFASARPYYTRSFPILASTLAGNPQYGDQLYMEQFHAQISHINWQSDTNNASGSERKLVGSPFANIHGDGDALRWGQDEESTDPITFNIAKGFWSSGTYPWGGTHNTKPFIDKLRIYQNGYGPEHSSPVYKEFDIEYQINLLYRVKVTQTVVGGMISDTDWLVVHPRRKAINYVEKGKDGKRRYADEANQPLNWSGTNKDRLNSDDAQTDIWIAPNTGGHDFKDLEFHFDGYTHDESGGGIHRWGKNGLHQSYSGNHRGAFFQSGYTGGGVFKQLGNEG